MKVFTQYFLLYDKNTNDTKSFIQKIIMHGSIECFVKIRHVPQQTLMQTSHNMTHPQNNKKKYQKTRKINDLP